MVEHWGGVEYRAGAKYAPWNDHGMIIPSPTRPTRPPTQPLTGPPTGPKAQSSGRARRVKVTVLAHAATHVAAHAGRAQASPREPGAPLDPEDSAPALEKLKSADVMAAFSAISAEMEDIDDASIDLEPFLESDCPWHHLLREEKVRKTFIRNLEAISLDDAKAKQVGEGINHLLSFSKVKQTVPENVMHRIEGVTSNLLKKLSEKSASRSIKCLMMTCLGQFQIPPTIPY